MQFKLLAELLNEAPTLSGIKGIVRDIKTGYDSAKERHEKAVDKVQKIQKDVQTKNKKNADDLQKSLNAAQTNDIHELTNQFLNEFFEQFPNYGATNGPEAIAEKLHTRAQALVAFNIFKNLGSKLTDLRDEMNKKLLASKKIDSAELRKFILDGEKLSETEPSTAIQQFVQREAKFFKRLIQVDDKFMLKAPDFKQLISMKLNATAPGRYADAVHALNILLSYMIAEIHGYAEHIAEVGRKLPEREIQTD